MNLHEVHSFAAGRWHPPGRDARLVHSAITGMPLARAGSADLDAEEILACARERGGPALRALTFHDRARLLKALAQHLHENRQLLYDLSYDTGATLNDHKIDVDGGIVTMRVIASKGRREMPDGHVHIDGPFEPLSRTGSFVGRHIAVPLQGAAIHINAFNFPVWGMLEKLAPTLLAGMPAIVKPATATCYVTEACFRLIIDSGLLPDGAVQLVCGRVDDLLDRVNGQDVVSFTGSAETALGLRQHPRILTECTRFMAEQDSLNGCVLGPDSGPGTPEFALFLDEVTTEMTVKAGQKCTAIRRVMVPAAWQEEIARALVIRLAKVRIGDPRHKETDMGALVSNEQLRDVVAKTQAIEADAERCTPEPAEVVLPDHPDGAFLQPTLFHCSDPDNASVAHNVEAFGPVATLMPYRDASHAARLLALGKGSLVASVLTSDPDFARDIALSAAAYHGRLYFNGRSSGKEATGHGAPLPHMVHGGPGRAGGGEELGGLRGVSHYMQRTAVQGSPDILAAVAGQWLPGAKVNTEQAHPFTRPFDALQIGERLAAGPREITLDDIETFAQFTGDTFYAHMDDTAAAANPFFPGRVAHGYLLLSFAAGLFVQPDPGPVLANTGLDNLRFLKPVSPGDELSVQLTVKAKTPRNETYGEVRWHVRLLNQHGEATAEYDLLTMNAKG
ncbi:MAG: phenylacetic acid degradation bifunctional protein PaaZ [Pseudomonadota bacterium]